MGPDKENGLGHGMMVERRAGVRSCRELPAWLLPGALDPGVLGGVFKGVVDTVP